MCNSGVSGGVGCALRCRRLRSHLPSSAVGCRAMPAVPSSRSAATAFCVSVGHPHNVSPSALLGRPTHATTDDDDTMHVTSAGNLNAPARPSSRSAATARCVSCHSSVPIRIKGPYLHCLAPHPMAPQVRGNGSLRQLPLKCADTYKGTLFALLGSPPHGPPGPRQRLAAAAAAVPLCGVPGAGAPGHGG